MILTERFNIDFRDTYMYSWNSIIYTSIFISISRYGSVYIDPYLSTNLPLTDFINSVLTEYMGQGAWHHRNIQYFYKNNTEICSQVFVAKQ